MKVYKIHCDLKDLELTVVLITLAKVLHDIENRKHYDIAQYPEVNVKLVIPKTLSAIRDTFVYPLLLVLTDRQVLVRRGCENYQRYSVNMCGWYKKSREQQDLQGYLEARLHQQTLAY